MRKRRNTPPEPYTPERVVALVSGDIEKRTGQHILVNEGNVMQAFEAAQALLTALGVSR